MASLTISEFVPENTGRSADMSRAAADTGRCVSRAVASTQTAFIAVTVRQGWVHVKFNEDKDITGPACISQSQRSHHRTLEAAEK